MLIALRIHLTCIYSISIPLSVNRSEWLNGWVHIRSQPWPAECDSTPHSPETQGHTAGIFAWIFKNKGIITVPFPYLYCVPRHFLHELLKTRALRGLYIMIKSWRGGNQASATLVKFAEKAEVGWEECRLLKKVSHPVENAVHLQHITNYKTHCRAGNFYQYSHKSDVMVVKWQLVHFLNERPELFFLTC